jgi:hypothetical protein
MSADVDGLSPQSTEPRRKMPIAASSTGRRPNVSDSLP